MCVCLLFIYFNIFILVFKKKKKLIYLFYPFAGVAKLISVLFISTGYGNIHERMKINKNE